MTPEKTLEAIYSLDNHQAWLGAWEIVTVSNELLDKEFLPYFTKIRSAVESLPQPPRPAMRDSRDIVKVALKILQDRSRDICRCNVYPDTDQLLPEKQAKYGLIGILAKEDIPWNPKFICVCKFCGQMFSVRENRDYHYPFSNWNKL